MVVYFEIKKKVKVKSMYADYVKYVKRNVEKLTMLNAPRNTSDFWNKPPSPLAFRMRTEDSW